MIFYDYFIKSQLRGDPDGCGGLDTSDGGPLRKGWLLRQTNNVSKHFSFFASGVSCQDMELNIKY